MSKSIKVILSILAILLIFGMIVWSVKNRKQKAVNNQEVLQNQNIDQNQQQEEGQNENSEEIDTSDWKTYRNAKYGYEIRYPLPYAVYKIGDGQYMPATENDESIGLKKEKDSDFIFGVYDTGTDVLSASSIKSQFGATDPNDIEIVSVVILGQSGYKLIFRKEDKSRVSDFYFLKTSNGNMLEITILTGNRIANLIFSSLRFSN